MVSGQIHAPATLPPVKYLELSYSLNGVWVGNMADVDVYTIFKKIKKIDIN